MGAAGPARARRILPRATLARHALFAAGAAVVLWLLTSSVSAYTNYKIAAVAFFAIAAAGLNVLTGSNGQLSLGHGALMAVGAYTTSVLLHHHPGVTVGGAVVASIVVTSAVGALVGVAAARLRGPYLAGATLALALAVPTIATHWAGIFGGESGVPVVQPVPPARLGADFPPERWLAWLALIAAVMSFVVLANLMRSRFGRDFRAVRDDEIASALAGIPVARTQIVAFVVSAACAGLAGSLLALWASLTAPSGFGLDLSLRLLAAIVLGGLGSLSGAVIGATLLVLIDGWTSGLADHFHLASAIRDNIPAALYGLVLIVAMLVFPYGIAGGARRMTAWARRRLRRAPA